MTGIFNGAVRWAAMLAMVCIVGVAAAQFEPKPLSARCQAMGGASVAVRDFSGSNVNPAMLGWLRRWNVSIDYRQLMVLKGMGYKSVALAAPTGNIGAAAVYYTHFGDLAYNEQSASLHYGIRVAKGVSVGVGVYYLHSGTNDGHYEPFNSATGSVGVQYSPNEKLCFGLSAFNLFFVRRDGVHRIPVQMNFGAAYKPLESLLITTELEKNIYDPLRVRLGVEYCIIDRIPVQAGVATSPMVYSIGVGYRHRHIRANLCVAVQQRVGVTPGVTLGYSF